MSTVRPKWGVSFGPARPRWGSWGWMDELRQELDSYVNTDCFGEGQTPTHQVVVIVKDAPTIRLIPSDRMIVYCPIDYYPSAAAIHRDRPLLERCDLIIVHNQSLESYFRPYALVEAVDHHARFVIEPSCAPRSGKYILWTGVRSNIGPLVEWVNANPLSRELVVLTNPRKPHRHRRSVDYGFKGAVRIERWSADKHLASLREALAIIDIKGPEFRSQHKPPTKAVDAVCSGVPLAMNPGAPAVKYLAKRGFAVADPRDEATWFSQEYRSRTIRFRSLLFPQMSRENIAREFFRILKSLATVRHGFVRKCETSFPPSQ